MSSEEKSCSCVEEELEKAPETGAEAREEVDLRGEEQAFFRLCDFGLPCRFASSVRK